MQIYTMWEPEDDKMVSRLQAPTAHSHMQLELLVWGSFRLSPVYFRLVSLTLNDTITMDSTFDNTATETIDLLEARLCRIEYAVSGQVRGPLVADGKPPVEQRLASLERALHQLAAKSRVIQDLLRIRRCSLYTWHHPLNGYRLEIPRPISITERGRHTNDPRHRKH